MHKYTTLLVDFLIWIGVLITVVVVNTISGSPFPVWASSLSALLLAIYWTLRTDRAQNDAHKEKLNIEKAGQESLLQKERLETLFTLTHDGVIVLDSHNSIMDINEAVTAMTGYTRDESIGKPCFEIFRSEKYKKMGLAFGLSMVNSQNPTYYEESALLTKDGRPIDIGARFAFSKPSPGHNSAGLILIRDLSKMHEIETLEHDFVSMTSHQLFTPLSIIRGHISMLLDGDVGKLTPKQKYFLEQSLSSTKRMVHLITELLSISRLEEHKITLNFAPVDLQSLLSGTVNELSSLAEHKRITLHFTSPAPHLAPANVDGEKISQVIQNLIDNAIKYTNDGGRVEIKCQQRAADFLISVSDNGIGIPATDIPKMFQRFYRSSNVLSIDAKGTGLGLYIAKVIVERHNGKIWVESKEGHGSTFFVSLPR